MRTYSSCLICKSPSPQGVESHGRLFFHCGHCDYIFQSPETRLSFEQERRRYLEHNNDLRDLRYLKYLEKTWLQVGPLPSGSVVLDYGCGPTKGLEKLLQPRYRVLSYDPIFWPQDLQMEFGKVDVIFCSEVIEHAFFPTRVFDHWNQLLRPGGLITLRTCFHPEMDKMRDWWYASDETHIGFFSQCTFEFIAKKWGWQLNKVHNPYVFATGPLIVH